MRTNHISEVEFGILKEAYQKGELDEDKHADVKFNLNRQVTKLIR